jgi:acyl-[acyl-carrier-protein]-phospholipid O-acyltransferase/long-chain-fatty-acid--[acyl-carrier-protein] ligase
MLISVLRWLLRLFYRFEAFNEQPLKTKGPILLLPNHVSWWDWLLVGVCLDEDWRFVTSSVTAKTSWLHRFIMVNRRTFPVDVNSPYAVKRMAEYLQTGGRLVLFPEGRLSQTGSLMKLFDGTGFLIHKTATKVITAYLRGAFRLPFSPNPNRRKTWPKLTVHFSDVLTAPALEHTSATEARARLTRWVRDRMMLQQVETEMALGPVTLPNAIDETAVDFPRAVVLQDATMQKLNFRRLLTAARALARRWGRTLQPDEKRVGVLLPNANALPVTVLSLWVGGRIPAILNYTTGSQVMVACARVAGLRSIITSEAFVSRAKLDMAPLTEAGVKIYYLEEIRAQTTASEKLLTLLGQIISPGLRAPCTDTNETALVLFTSGSEGEPKGVELTHRNILANIRQMLSVIDLNEADRFFNALPLFHSFGVSVGLLLPLTRGVFTFLYLSPLHYRVVPSAFYNLNCTVFFGTNTFLNGYARKAHPYDFRSLRYLFAGAEKLQESTAAVWSQKFGVRILEGYGATECSPCVSVNVPMQSRPGTGGRLLPGIQYKLEVVEGVSDPAGQAGRLLVRGPNIMKGYLNPEPNSRFLKLNGWYDTGDIVRIDDDGYVHILGRLKRFAKVSGEMVSLAAVEEVLAGAFPQYGLKFAIAVLAKPDAERGEKLIAVTNEPRLRLEELRDVIRRRGLSNLAVPREILHIREIPRLGTGKVNHRELQTLLASNHIKVETQQLSLP